MSKIAIRKSFEPRLYYLSILLNATNAVLKVNALIDTGCAKSAMSKLTYLKLLSQNKIYLLLKAKLEFKLAMVLITPSWDFYN